jgi:hypothetical protein
MRRPQLIKRMHPGMPALELKPTIHSCPLCDAVQGEPLFIENVNVNTILGRSESFLIIPALGPLVVGHVLAISTGHTSGLRYLSAAVQQSYEQLSIKLRTYCAQFGDPLLEAEHGAHDSSARGPCIRHTHVHILPALANAASIFDARSNLERIHSTSNSIGSYLWVNGGDGGRTYDASRAIGQEIRRSVGEYLGVENWDWAVNPNVNLIAETIEYWNKVNECPAWIQTERYLGLAR